MYRKSLLLLLVMCVTGVANGVTVVNETFTDGSRTDGVPVSWYATESPIVAVGNDATLASGNAMSVTTTSTSTTINRRIAANFAAQTLTNVGDGITLSADFRLTSLGTTGNTNRGFKIGLFNSNGTMLSADLGNTAEPTSSTTNALSNDQGYQIALGTGTTGTSSLIKENGVGATFMGGTDLAYYQGTADTTVQIRDLLKHSLVLSIVKDSATTYKIDFTLDGGGAGKSYTAADIGTTPLVTTFNEIGIANGAYGTGFVVDNVVVSTIPEPATMAILGLGGLIISRRRRNS